MSETCSDNLYVKPYEVCNFKALQLLSGIVTTDNYFSLDKTKNDSNIFHDDFKTNNPDLNINFRDADNNYIYTNVDTKKDLCYSPNNNSNFSVNCAIIAKNPYFTYDKKKKACTPIPNLKLPEDFSYEYENDNTYIYKTEDEESAKFNFSFKKKQAYCENKWYDWIITPNYHFGNQYEKDPGIYSKNDVFKCYKPCNKGYLPYSAANGSNICALKANILDGMYSNKLDYSPIALINLIGNSTENVTKLYNLIKLKSLEKYQSGNSKYIVDSTVDTSNNTTTEINDCYSSMKQVLWINILDKLKFDIKNYQYNKDVLTYKNPLFNENDPELLTYRGMSKANMLSDDILFHTFYIAYKHEDFINNLVNNIKKKVETASEIDENTYYNHGFNITSNINNLITDKKTDEQTDKVNKYKQRIANIFYKAINICYDGKTDFSKNILIKTKTAIENLDTSIKDIYYPSEIPENYAIELNKIKDKDNLEIKFYSEKDYTTNINITTTVADKSTLVTKANTIIKNKEKINFFTTEDNEKSNNRCTVANQILNIETGICESCDTVCKKDSDKTKNTCITNSRCALFCKDNCKPELPTAVNKCGKINTPVINKPLITKDINTPIDENSIFFLNDISYYFKLAIKIIFSLIIIYLCYIFYQLFGDTIITIINLVLFYISYWYYRLGNLFSSNDKSFENSLNEYKKQNAINKYDRLVTKANDIII